MSCKKITALLITLAIPLLFVSFTYLKSAGAHPGATGAPGDGSCADAGCHTGNVVQNDTKVNSLLFPTADSTYIPGQIYLVKIRVNNPGIQRFGFEAGALFEASAKNAGMIKLTEPDRTQLLSHKVNNDTRREITHTQNGNSTVTAGSTEWTFTWVAPATDQGNVIFYYATNSANNNAEVTGDNICLSTFKLKPKKADGIEEFISSPEMFAFYNPDTHTLEIRYDVKKETTVKIFIIDASGQQVYSDTGEQKTPGRVTEKIMLPANGATGIYYVNLHCGNNSQLTKKVMIR
jgi:hypothetical protein